MVYSKKGKDDDPKKDLLEAMDAYLTDKLNLQTFYRRSVHQGLLYGHVSSQQAYKVETQGSELINDSNGNPILDEKGNEIKKPIVTYDDPVVIVDNPQKTYFSPGSVYSEDCDSVPYIIREKTMSPDQIEEMYGIKVKADVISGVDGEGLSDSEKEVIGATTIYEYIGLIPSSVDKFGGTSVRIIFTSDKELLAEQSNKYCTQAKLYGDDDTSGDFFGFGLAYILRDLQKELSISKSQMVRMRDMYAYPKPVVKDSERIETRSLYGTQGNEVIKFTETPPSYLVPPSPPGSIIASDQAMEAEAQSRSGSMDMSKGAQNSNTIKTATGQQIFADSMEVLVEDAKKIFGEYYRVTMINILKLCQKNWQNAKTLEIVDDETGDTKEFSVDSNILASINFDTDVDVRLEDVTYNKDIKRRDILNMYSTMSDSPVVNKEELTKFVLKEAFGVKDFERFIIPQNDQTSPSTETPNQELSEKPENQNYGPYSTYPTGPRT